MGVQANSLFGSDLRGAHAPRVGPVVPVVDFPGINPTFAVEGFAIAPNNDLFVGTPYEGEIFRVTHQGEVSVFARLVKTPDDAYVLGLAVAGDETLYAAVLGCNVPAMNGVWHIDAKGQATLVMPIPSDGCWTSGPNNVAFDDQGNLYVTDSINGSMWRLGEDGDVTMWVQDALLLAPPGSFFGANGLAYRDHSLWVDNTDAGSVVRIPILRHGMAGKPRVFVQSSLLVGIDDCNFDVAGNLYVGNVYTNDLFRISPQGDIETLITAEQFAPFHWPTNSVFGFGEERTTLYIDGANPSVVKVDVGIPGMLMPQFEQSHESH